ncbi:hypothetical protein [Microbacterium sp. CGR1]|uniref:hypothetical protein n=1 Tax=Microbacterium sp. CGR1 TaxID=1696072 RepID=UPI003DA48F83
MTSRVLPRARLMIASVALLTVIGLTGCTQSEPLTSPVGEWVAVDDDSGTLTIREDGTFTITDASYNPIQAHDADDDYNASGTWQILRDDRELKLDFKEATEGDSAKQTSGLFAPFSSGAIRFHDPDEILDIEFRLSSETVD